MKLVKVNDPEEIEYYRQTYYEEILAPIDGMWEMLFYAGAESYLINLDGKSIGYCKIDEAKCLYLVYLEQLHKIEIDQFINELIATKKVSSAKMASSEPLSFNACLSRANSVTLDTFLYQYPNELKPNLKITENQRFVLAASKDKQITLDFFKAHANFDDQFGYTDRLLSRSELYFLYENDKLVATGECRLSDSQPNYADVGMIVNTSERGRGLATLMLNLLVDVGLKKGRKLICSTTHDNPASQIAIYRSGFISMHRIYQMTF